MGSNAAKFYGKFRGVVTENRDPLMLGRVRARVTDVLGEVESGWAMPAAPFGGDQMGFFALPSIGAGVWFEFEHGDPTYPIWSGAWWGSAAELPAALRVSPPYQKVMLRTQGGHTITLDDAAGSGGITLETATGQKLSLSERGIEIDDGKGARISLTGPQVSVNDGALDVT
jgi:uncharacterized protein involved in type VI secretion and phage assembly